MVQPTKKLHLVSLGCARNQVDSEVMLGLLQQNGWTFSPEAATSDAVIVNTCGFIGAAKEESIDTILELAEHKKSNPDLKLVVSGCLAQRYKKQLARNLPEVDFFIGTDEFVRLPELLADPPEVGTIHARRTNYLYDHTSPRINALSGFSAYVKVAEGCQHNCAFCIIPAIRGKLRSREVASVVTEVQKLVESGVKEVNLIAQDLAAFGRDRGADETLELLKALEQIEGLQWIRMLYMYPENIKPEFIEHFRESTKLVKYLDVPVQHASDRILKAMKRDVNSAQIRETVANLRAQIPDIAIRTTVMVGFPGETEADFNELVEFVREMKFDHLGCFEYSLEEGTVAARLPDQVDDEIKRRRLEAVMAVQQEVSASNLSRRIGGTYPVLVTGTSDKGGLMGRVAFQAPEVDGDTYLEGTAEVGDICLAEIVDSFDYDLVARIKQPSTTSP